MSRPVPPAGARVTDADPFAPDAIRDPYGFFGRLRDEGSVHWLSRYGFWVVTAYDDVRWVVRHPELLSSDEYTSPRAPYPPIRDADLPAYDRVRGVLSSWFLKRDPPRHTAIRQLLERAFTPQSVEAWRPLVREVIADLLDSIEGPRFDLMTDFAAPLPVMVMGRILELPVADRRVVGELVSALLLLGRGEADRMTQLDAALQRLRQYLGDITRERATRGGTDVLSVLLDGERQGCLSRDEVLDNTILLLFGAHETTINLVCNGMLAFIRNPAEWRAFREDPEHRCRAATEECLRYDPPIKSVGRIAATDLQMPDGTTLRRGDRLRWVIASAHRDPRHFDHPDAFDIGRANRGHLAFGGGIHHCIGAGLARLEGQEALKAIAERFGSLTLEADTLDYVPSLSFRTLVRMPVRRTRAQRKSAAPALERD